jgi:hypothetical protein
VAPAGTREGKTAAPAVPRGAAPARPAGGAVTGTGTGPRPAGVAGPATAAPGAPAPAATAPQAVRTKEAAPEVGRVPRGPTIAVAATGTDREPRVLATGAPQGAPLAPPGRARPVVSAPRPATAALGPPTAAPGPATAAPGPATAPSAAKVMAIETVVARPGLNAARGEARRSRRRGSPSPAGRCRPDGAVSPAMAHGTSKTKVLRRRRSGPRPAASSRRLARPGPPWRRSSGPSAHPGPGSRRGHVPLVPAPHCSGRGTGRVRRSSRRPQLPQPLRAARDRRPPVAAPAPPKPAGGPGPPAARSPAVRSVFARPRKKKPRRGGSRPSWPTRPGPTRPTVTRTR